MLQGEADVCAVKSVGVVTVGIVYVFMLFERLAECCAYEVFVSQFGAYGSSTERPVEIRVKVYAIHVGAVVVVSHSIGASLWNDVVQTAEIFEAVHVSVPVYRWAQVQFTASGVSL